MRPTYYGSGVQYRDLGKTGFRASVLGFGAMRLPQTDHKPPLIDERMATDMLARAVDGGVNYVDSAYDYHGGQSEVWLGRALRELAARRYGDAPDRLDRLRAEVKIATKMPVWQCSSAADFDRIFEEQLERLASPSVDFYLLHSLREATWRRVLDLGVLEWAQRRMALGHIGHLGFSFHDEYDVFLEILAATPLWEFCQIQLNYMDVEYQAGLRGLRAAAERGLGVIVMEPIRGGRLAAAPPAVQQVWDTASVRRSPAEWALQWVWSLPEVSLVLSGMSAPGQVDENLMAAARSRPSLLDADDLHKVEQVRQIYRSLMLVDCTGCGYCQPCPQGVKIPDILELVNDAAAYGALDRERMSYSWLDEEGRADRCIACGECESVCPQQISIADWMRRAHEMLGE